MNRQRILLIITAVVAILLVASLTLSITSDQDPYDYHTGFGSTLSVSPDNAALLFSYYENGRESIYLGHMDDGTVEKVTEPVKENHRMPQFSPDGEGIVYLSADHDGVQSLYYQDSIGGKGAVNLTGSDAHIADAAFSPDGRTIYYIAMPADDFLKPEGEKDNGADLFTVATEGGEAVKLTDKDSFAMDGLAVSADGQTLYYTEFDGVQKLTAYSLEDGTENTPLQGFLRGDVYQPEFSPNNKLLAYTAVSEASRDNGSTFEYELFLLETSTGETDKLTSYRASVTSPAFFHEDNRIAFLAQPNWPSQPEDFEVMTVDASTGEILPLRLDVPETTSGFQLAILAYWFTNPIMMTVLYLLLFGLLTVYSKSAKNQVYLPAHASAVLTILVIGGSFAAGVYDPWMGIGLFMLAGGLTGCTAGIYVFALVYSSLKKSKSRKKVLDTA